MTSLTIFILFTPFLPGTECACSFFLVYDLAESWPIISIGALPSRRPITSAIKCLLLFLLVLLLLCLGTLRAEAVAAAQKRSTHAAQRGTWAAPYYAARTPEGVVEDIGTFQFDVEGEDIHTLKAHIMRLDRWIKSFNGAMIEATRLE